MHFANVHFGYTASIIGLLFAPVALASQPPLAASALAAFGVSLFVASFLFHRRGEYEEYCELCQLEEGKMDLLAVLLFGFAGRSEPALESVQFG